VNLNEGALTMDLIKAHDDKDEQFVNDYVCMNLKMNGTETLGEECID